MSWLAWRQLRSSLVAGVVLVAVVAVGLVMFGFTLRRASPGDLRDFRTPLYLVDALMLAAPGVVGAFWGGPLVAREFEAGTHRLVWNQTVSRRRWLVVKLLVVGLAAAVLVGALGAVVTWAAAPYDEVVGDRFTPLVFGARNVAPLAYALFGVVLGAVLGLLLRRTLPAVALTLLLFVAVQVALPTLVRPHLAAPVRGDAPLTAAAVHSLTFLGADATIRGMSVPGGWVVSNGMLLTADGRPVDRAAYQRCVLGSTDDAPTCLSSLDLHVSAAYHPASRYWRFQVLESLLVCAVALLLAAAGLWRVRFS